MPDLLRRADIAMDHAHIAAARPPGVVRRRHGARPDRPSELEQGIRYGLDHEQFLPFFEPQVDLATGQITGFEVLARWHHPLSGTILPDIFIPVAEETGLIGPLSEQVIARRAAFGGWDPAIAISVNISPVQLTDGWLAQKILRILAEPAFPADGWWSRLPKAHSSPTSISRGSS